MTDFHDIARARFATERFDGTSVSEAEVQSLLELIRLAPSSFNLQPWRLRLISDQATKDSLGPASYNQAQIATCSHLLVFLADTRLESLADRLEVLMREGGVIEARLTGFLGLIRTFIGNLQGQERLDWAQKQVYLALAQGMLGATALGLDTCPMEGFDAAAYSRILGLPSHLVPTVLMPMGHSADEPPTKLRFGVAELLVD